MYTKIDKELEKRYKITDFPLNIAIEPTNRCNLNCIMCDNDKLTRPRGNMDIRLYKRIIDEIAEESPQCRIWLDFYGEALIVGWKLYYMIDYAKKRGCTNVCINSNGVLMKPEFSDMLLDSGVDFISLDCDGFSKETYEKIRVNGNRDTFYNNVEYLLEERNKRGLDTLIDVKVIEMDENKDEIKKITDYWQKRGAITAVRRRATWVGIQEYDAENQKDRIACGHGVGICAISWDGRIAICSWDADCSVTIGNVSKGDKIRDIWKKRNESFVKAHFNHEWDKLPEFCQKCNNWKIVGEERSDPSGKKLERNYDSKGNIYQ